MPAAIVEVRDSYKFSDGRIIAFLHTGEKLPGGLLVDDLNKKQWQIRQYYRTTNSPEGYERIADEEKKGIFQYLLAGIGHEDKPLSGRFLRLDHWGA